MTKKYSISKEILGETRKRSYLGISINILFSLLLLLTVNSLFDFQFKFFILVYLILLISFTRWVHLISFDLMSPEIWHRIFSVMIAITGTLWSCLIYFTLDSYHTDIKIVTLVHMVFSGMVATASYSLALVKRDYYLFGSQILLAPFVFFIFNNETDMNSGFVFATLTAFYVLVSLVRRDYSRQWADLLNQKKELNLIINSFPGGVSLIKDRKYIYVNEVVSKYTGIEPNLFINEPVGFVLEDHSFFTIYDDFEKSELKKLTQEVTLTVDGKEKLFFLLLKKMEGDDSIVIAITLDIHGQRQNEMALQSAAKMAAIGEMSSSLAHEINNPLAVISAQVNQLVRALDSLEFPVAEKTRFEAGLQRIYKTVFRISEIIKGLRQIARNDTSDPKQLVIFEEIIQETLSLCEAKCKNKGIEIRNGLDSRPSWVLCHPAQMLQVILNLINNSIYAVENLDEKWIEVSTIKMGDTVVVKVKDSGRGIDKSVADKIMTPFFTTKPTGKGTGLGLSISKSIIEQHLGNFYYDSTEKNTTFAINLTLATEPHS